MNTAFFPLTNKGVFNNLLEKRHLFVFLAMSVACISGIQIISDLSTANASFNNYLVFKNVFYHTINQVNLYAEYPAAYRDVNLYGPFFSVVIAPFALLYDEPGIICWVLFNAGLFIYAINKLPVSNTWRSLLMILCLNELHIATEAAQTNPLTAACIILGFVFTKNKKEHWALFFILFGAFIKIYSIAGLLFFFLSDRKGKFVLWGLLWSAVFFFLPVLISNFHFILNSYSDWFAALKSKNVKNDLLTGISIHQNIAVQGMIRRIFSIENMNDLFILVPAALVQLSLFIYYKHREEISYGLSLLSATLLATVIFSSSAESSTYIIAVPGMILWFLQQHKSRAVIIFFVAAFLLTSFAYSDLLTPWTRRNLYRPYSLKALFPFIIWIILCVQVHTKQFLSTRKNLAIT